MTEYTEEQKKQISRFVKVYSNFNYLHNQPETTQSRLNGMMAWGSQLMNLQREIGVEIVSEDEFHGILHAYKYMLNEKEQKA